VEHGRRKPAAGRAAGDRSANIEGPEIEAPMNDRARALAILKEAREVLAKRLEESILDAGEEILADARGESYMNEIDGLYEQVGMRLSHISQMLANLPIEPPPPFSTSAHANHREEDIFSVATDAAPHHDAIITDTLPAIAGPVFVTTPALPAPQYESHSQSDVSFQTFAAQIQANDLLSAGQTLAELFELDEPRAIDCTLVFAEHLQNEPGFLRKVTQLRHELHDGRRNAAILLLLECFGMTGPEAASVLSSVRGRLNDGE
jgi:hypothetical protein